MKLNKQTYNSKERRLIMEFPAIFSLIDQLELQEEKDYVDLQTTVNIFQQIFESKNNYRTVQKWTGYKYRILTIPRKYLKEIQKKILKKILYQICYRIAKLKATFEAREDCKGIEYPIVYCGIPGRSIKDTAEIHIKSKTFFKIDLSNAFDYATKDMIKTTMIKLYSASSKEQIDLVELISRLTITKNCLPQGAPTSTFLFNIACFQLDQIFIKLLEQSSWKKARLFYTRYADDIVISSTKYGIPVHIRKKIINTIKKYGFKINRKKLQYRTGFSRVPKVLGININSNEKMTLPRKLIEEYRATIHNEVYTEKPNKNKIHGIISWCIYIEGEINSRLKKPYQLFLRKCTENKQT